MISENGVEFCFDCPHSLNPFFLREIGFPMGHIEPLFPQYGAFFAWSIASPVQLLIFFLLWRIPMGRVPHSYPSPFLVRHGGLHPPHPLFRPRSGCDSLCESPPARGQCKGKRESSCRVFVRGGFTERWNFEGRADARHIASTGSSYSLMVGSDRK